jgi:hypothetical protein
MSLLKGIDGTAVARLKTPTENSHTRKSSLPMNGAAND